MSTAPVSPEELSWSCPPSAFGFSTTAELAPVEGILGQEAAVEALRFGLTIGARGHNVFVRGRPGTGRRTLVLDLLKQLPAGAPLQDRVFVYNFAEPDQPRLLSLAPGQAPTLRSRADEIVRFVLEDLPDHVNTDSLRVRTHQLEAEAEAEAARLSAPFNQALAEAGLALVEVEEGDETYSALMPLIEGQPVAFEDLEQVVEAGQLEAQAAAQLHQQAQVLQLQLQSLSTQVVRLRKRTQRAIARLVASEVRQVMTDALADVPRTFPGTGGWVQEIIDDVSERIGQISEAPVLAERYRIRILCAGSEQGCRPVVTENAPTVQRLLGGIDVPQEQAAAAPHLGIHAGALLKANGGVLVLQARDVLSEPGAWEALTRALRSGTVELTPSELGASTLRAQHLRPEPIPIRVKVVLVGGPEVWAALDLGDPDFSELFKVLVDLDDVLERDERSISLYAQVVARIVADESLPPFTAGAVGALVEHGARIAAEAGKLTARFGRVADLLRGAAFLAQRRGIAEVHRQDVHRAVLEGRRRADLPSRRFREQLGTGTIHIATRGAEIGQVNGLAVVQAGPLDYGFPMRITATLGAGERGTVHLVREAELSGQIHTKGFLTVQGLLRYLLDVPHPLAFDASITHEQSYGGVDGDSASAAEFVCLMSALTSIPARQGLAMTGAIDQHGNILPVGAVDSKIEGFFDACAVHGLDGAQGVLIPSVGVRDLQLRRDVVEAARAERFAVYGVSRIEEALALMLGKPADEVRAIAVSRLDQLWRASARPVRT